MIWTDNDRYQQIFKDTTSPVPLEEKDFVISPSSPEVSPQIDIGTFPQALSPLGNPVASQRSAADSVNAAETSALQWQWGEAPAKDWCWSLSLFCRKGCFRFHLEPCPLSWHYTGIFFLSLSHHSVTCHHMEKKKNVKGNFMQSNNQRISDLCSVIIQRTCLTVSALAYTGSRDISYQFPFHFCAY